MHSCLDLDSGVEKRYNFFLDSHTLGPVHTSQCDKNPRVQLQERGGDQNRTCFCHPAVMRPQFHCSHVCVWTEIHSLLEKEVA